jgi:hypothetical protein
LLIGGLPRGLPVADLDCRLLIADWGSPAIGNFNRQSAIGNSISSLQSAVQSALGNSICNPQSTIQSAICSLQSAAIPIAD